MRHDESKTTALKKRLQCFHHRRRLQFVDQQNIIQATIGKFLSEEFAESASNKTSSTNSFTHGTVRFGNETELCLR